MQMDYGRLTEAFTARRQYGWHPVMALAMLTHPKYVGRWAGVSAEVMAAAEQQLRKMAAPTEGPAGVYAVKQFRLLQNPANRSKLNLSPLAFAKGLVEDPQEWWRAEGMDMPALQEVALKVHSMPATACSIERGWSNCSHVLSKKRTSLLATRMEKLVFIYFNSRALGRRDLLDAPNWEQFVKYMEQCDGEDVMREAMGSSLQPLPVTGSEAEAEELVAGASPEQPIAMDA